MRTALLVSLVCLAACNNPQTSAPPEPVDPPLCWATPSESQSSTPAPSASLLGFASIDRHMISKPIRENMKAIKCCYELGLQRDPDLHGRVVVTFDIEADGRVGEIEITEDTLDDPIVARCVAEVGKRLWSWPDHPGAGTVRISYPFLFSRP